jgi:lysozyme family protein|tara:strand:- start:241 stop:912 length:672 start_codon:yes stop_codon:yes gene_type:complete
MIDIIINFLKSLFIKDKEEPSILHDVSIEALHNLSVTGDDVAKALGHMDEDGEFITEVQQEKQEMSKFDEIIEGVLKHEGGYVNDPTDLGGETNYGITKRFYPDVDIKNLTKEGAKEIYKKDYWDKNKVDDLPDDLKHIYFDMCVNQGRGTAVKVLQRAINGKGGKIAVDGGFGPGTKGALAKYKPSVERVRCYRLKHYYDLVNKKPEQEKFLFGWYRRALEV